MCVCRAQVEHCATADLILLRDQYVKEKRVRFAVFCVAGLPITNFARQLKTLTWSPIVPAIIARSPATEYFNEMATK